MQYFEFPTPEERDAFIKRLAEMRDKNEMREFVDKVREFQIERPKGEIQ